MLELWDMTTVIITVLEKPIARIRENCAMAGLADSLDQALSELEAYLKGEVADGEASEARLTYNGLCFFKELFARSRA
jgi:hypothetical protein